METKHEDANWVVLGSLACSYSGSSLLEWRRNAGRSPMRDVPSGYVPFTTLYAIYTASPGDIVVGAMTTASYDELSAVPLPAFPNQTFCVPIQLAPGSYYTAYVPTVLERLGDFSYYLSVLPNTQLYNPISGAPYNDNQIPVGSGVFAWHVAFPALAPPDETQAILSRVNMLTSQGVLNHGQDNSQVQQLQHAVAMMNAGKTNGAIWNPAKLHHEVQDLESSGVLTSGQATVLIDAANTVIGELTNLNSRGPCFIVEMMLRRDGAIPSSRNPGHLRSG